MNTTLAARRSLDREGRTAQLDDLSHRLSPVDRLTLRLGLWLLLRSTRRIRPVHDHEGHARALVSQRARDARDAVTHEHLRAHRA